MSIAKLSLSLTAVLVAAVPATDAAASLLGMPPDQPSQPIQPPGQVQPPTQMPGQGQMPGQMPGQVGQEQTAITDAEIFAVLESIADANIDQARNVKKMVTDKRVKKFAESVIKRNTAAKRRHATLRTRHNIQTTAGQTSQSFEREAEQTFADMQGLEKGANYDRMYIDNQVELLTNAIGYVNNRLLPNAQLAALRTELQTVVSQLEGDLKSAQKLQSQLSEKTS